MCNTSSLSNTKLFNRKNMHIIYKWNINVLYIVCIWTTTVKQKSWGHMEDHYRDKELF